MIKNINITVILNLFQDLNPNKIVKNGYIKIRREKWQKELVSTSAEQT